MSLQNLKTWKSYSLGYNSEMQKCWVPNCLSSRTSGYTKNLFHLPVDIEYRELWIAMAGKKVSGAQKEIYFCQNHFRHYDMELIMNQPIYLKETAIPFYQMPQKICRTCMLPIGSNEMFSVLSRTIPSRMPTDMKLNLPQCRPEPLYQILTFCIPDLNLQPDPPPLICFKCYHNVWLYFAFKITSNAVEKGLRGNLTQEEYGRMVLCRTCPQTAGTSFFILGEDTLMGTLLKNMFLNDHPSNIVPLKVCLKCWNMLYKLKSFYEQCMTVEQKMHRHNLLNQTGLADITQYAVAVPSTLGTSPSAVTQLRAVRKGHHTHHDTGPTNRKDATHPQRPQHTDHNIGCDNVAKSNCKPPTGYVANSTLSPSNSVIKFTGNTEQREKKESNILPPDPKVSSEPQIQVAKTFFPPSAVEAPENGPRSKFFALDEKIALAQLMLRFGEPLKYKSNPDIQFDAWINIVKEFHKINNQRSLESIQTVWTRMKKKAVSTHGLIGPADFLDQLVIYYMYGYPTNCVVNNIMPIEKAVVGQKDDVVRSKSVGTCDSDKSATDMEKVGQLNVENGKSTSTAPVQKEEPIIILLDDDDPPISVKDPVIPTTPLSSNEVPIKRRRGRPAKNPVAQKLQSKQETSKKPNKGVKHKSLGVSKLKKKKKGEKRKIAAKTHDWGYIQRLKLAQEIRKEYDNCLKNDELISGKTPWKLLISRVQKKTYKGHSFDKLYYIWNRMKRSATIYEKNGQDLVDEEVFELLQTQESLVKSLVTVKTNKNASIVVSDDSNDDDSSFRVPVKISPKSDVKKQDKKKYQYWTEDDKMEFFKLIKMEFSSMVKNKEPLACPWRKIIQKIASRGYKNFNQEMLFSSWSAIRRNATLHENDRQLTILDCKVLRLLKLSEKLKKIKETVKPVNVKNDQEKPNRTAGSKKIVDDENTEDIASKEALGKSQHKETPRSSKGRKRVASDSDEDEATGDDDNGHKFSSWTHQEKLDLIEVIKRYGNTVFSGKLKRSTFWPQVLADHRAKGYKREVLAVTSYWHLLHRSAKLAWAQQKEPSACDKVIIDFMMELIEKKKKEGGCSNEGMIEEDDCDDEISDRSPFQNSLESEDTNDQIFGTDDGEDRRHVKQEDYVIEHGGYSGHSENQENVDDDDIVNLNYDYVSLADLDCGASVTNEAAGFSFKTEPSLKVEYLKDEPAFKDEPAYVSMEDCGVEAPLEPKNEIIVIDDSDEE